jgi:4-hydroxymandelate oxidase
MQPNNPIKAGDSNQITREYLDSLLIELRHINAVVPSTQLELYGHTFSTPIMTAALSHLNGCHPEGLAEVARGAKAADAVMWCGMGDEAELESITKTGAKTIKIIKPYADHDIIFRKIKHAEQCGALAVGMDIDHVFSGNGQFATILGSPMSAKSLSDIESFVKSTKLPFILKGILSEQDAYLCAQAGVGGIVVSHHHGITDYAVPPLMILPNILKAVEGKLPVFVDCGINSGADAFKALALGATAVSTGRIIMGPLAKEGASGVTAFLQKLTDELAGIMSLTASADIRHIDPSVIWHR